MGEAQGRSDGSGRITKKEFLQSSEVFQKRREVTAEEEIRAGDDIILTRLGVTRVDEEVGVKARRVTHIQVQGWGDHSAPDNTHTLLHSIKKVQDLTKSKRFEETKTIETQMGNIPVFSSRFSSPSPVLVHCSAGVGRTGTWIAVYRLVRRLCDRVGPNYSNYSTIRIVRTE